MHPSVRLWAENRTDAWLADRLRRLAQEPRGHRLAERSAILLAAAKRISPEPAITENQAASSFARLVAAYLVK